MEGYRNEVSQDEGVITLPASKKSVKFALPKLAKEGEVPTRGKPRSEQPKRLKYTRSEVPIAGAEALALEEPRPQIEDRLVVDGQPIDPVVDPDLDLQPRVILEQLPGGQQDGERRSRYGRLIKAPQRFVSFIRAVFDHSDSDSD